MVNTLPAALWEALLDALVDSVKLLPFLFAAYLLIEYIEHRASDKLIRSLTRFGRFSPLAGAAAGLVPQCGFSVTAANLYSGGLISFGTLAAVFSATSDEALPILLASGAGRGAALRLLFVKLIAAAATGFAVDALYKGAKKHDTSEFHRHIHEDCGDDCCKRGIVRPSLGHTATSFLFILASIFLINCAFMFIGEDAIASVFKGSALLQPLLAAAIGFIPNCASSILLTELYLGGALSFGSLAAGLVTNSGIGILVLLRSNRNMKENLSLVAILLLTGILTGFVVQLF